MQVNALGNRKIAFRYFFSKIVQPYWKQLTTMIRQLVCSHGEKSCKSIHTSGL